jgi:hypothetical protein
MPAKRRTPRKEKPGARRVRRPEQQRVQEPPQEKVRKIVYAIGFDLYDNRTVLRWPGGGAEPGEPARGVGPLKAPWNGQGNRPLPWAETPHAQPLPPVCPDPQAQIPQPAHNRWQNSRGRIALKIDPGMYSIYLDDLDCSSADVRIWKGVELRVARGNIRFAGPGDGRQLVWRSKVYLEPKGWSLQPAPIIFGGRLMVGDNLPAAIEVNIFKCAENANPDGSYNVLGSGGIEVLINP